MDDTTVKLNEPSTLSMDIDGAGKSLYELAVYSIQGSRQYQQDTVFADFSDRRGIAMVCDGMGGMDEGDRASRLAATQFAEDYAEHYRTYGEVKWEGLPEYLEAEAVKLDKMVHELKNPQGVRLNSGTTIVATIFEEDRLTWLSVGDSRIYLIRGDEMEIVTRPHNYGLSLDLRRRKGLISEEEYMAEQSRASALISFIGIGNVRLMDINKTPFRLEKGDMVLVCSDGLYNCLPDGQIFSLLKKESRNIQETAARLIQEVNLAGKRYQDNTSLILIRYTGE